MVGKFHQCNGPLISERYLPWPSLPRTHPEDEFLVMRGRKETELWWAQGGIAPCLRNVLTSSEGLLPLKKRNLLKKRGQLAMKTQISVLFCNYTSKGVGKMFWGLSLCCKQLSKESATFQPLPSGGVLLPLLICFGCLYFDVNNVWICRFQVRISVTPVHCGKFQKKDGKVRWGTWPC